MLSTFDQFTTVSTSHYTSSFTCKQTHLHFKRAQTPKYAFICISIVHTSINKSSPVEFKIHLFKPFVKLLTLFWITLDN